MTAESLGVPRGNSTTIYYGYGTEGNRLTSVGSSTLIHHANGKLLSQKHLYLERGRRDQVARLLRRSRDN